MRNIYLYILFLFITSSQGFAQLSIEDIDLNRISQKKIRDYIVMQQDRDVHLLSDFKPSCKGPNKLPDLYNIVNSYLVKASPDRLWDIYKNTNISESWEGKMISFGLLFSKWSDLVCYRNESYASSIDTGQVFFINLKVLKGAINLPVGIEVVEVNDQKRLITFSYLEGNTAQGEQSIQLIKTDEGFTKIIHTANFKSEYPFRDKHLYPHYHTKAVNELHKKMASLLIDDKKGFVIYR